MRKNILILILIVIVLMSIFTVTACANDAKRVENADVRIMSANILADIAGWGGSPVKPRLSILKKIIDKYQPDVVGLQEYCEEWQKFLPSQIADTYSFIQTQKENYTTIIYNHKKLKLLDSGYYVYSQNTNKNCRAVTWGVFENIESKDKFIVTNTHWEFGMDEGKVFCRNSQLIELAKTIEELVIKYNLPIFATGDYNVFEYSIDKGAESYNKFLEIANMSDAKFFKGIEKKNGRKTKYENETRDHIFVRGDINPLVFNILADNIYTKLSDHFFIYVDAELE